MYEIQLKQRRAFSLITFVAECIKAVPKHGDAIQGIALLLTYLTYNKYTVYEVKGYSNISVAV